MRDFQRTPGDPANRRVVTKLRFDEYARGWVDTFPGNTARGLSDSTREGYRRSIEAFAIPVLGRYRLAEVTPPDIRALIRAIEAHRVRGADDGAPMKATSIRKHLAPVKALFATAYADGLIPSNPTQGVRVAAGRAADPDDDGRVKAMTREELGLVIAALPEPWRPFLSFLATTGVRVSEAIGLTWADVDLGTTPCVAIRRQRYRGTVSGLKSRHARRTIPLHPDMAAVIRDLRARGYVGEDAPVFATRGRDGSAVPLNARNVQRRVLDPVVDALGLGWVSFHAFRHTCAYLLFEEGVDIKTVQTRLGQADPAFTLRTHVHLMDRGRTGGAGWARCGGRSSGSADFYAHNGPELLKQVPRYGVRPLGGKPEAVIVKPF